MHHTRCMLRSVGSPCQVSEEQILSGEGGIKCLAQGPTTLNQSRELHRWPFCHKPTLVPTRPWLPQKSCDRWEEDLPQGRGRRWLKKRLKSLQVRSCRTCRHIFNDSEQAVERDKITSTTFRSGGGTFYILSQSDSSTPLNNLQLSGVVQLFSKSECTYAGIIKKGKKDDFFIFCHW